MKFTANDRKEIKDLLKNDVFRTLTEQHKQAIPIVNIDTISNNTWLFIRSLLGIGGSESAGLMGVSPYTNPVKIYANKFPYLYRKIAAREEVLTDEQIEEIIAVLEKNNEDKDFNTQFLLDYGHFMEDFIAQQYMKVFADRYKDDYEDLFSKRYGKYMEIVDVEVYKDSILYRHATEPIFADFDYRIRLTFADGTIEEGIFECKTASSYHIKSKWEESFPEYYNTQVRQYMAIANVNFFVICCIADNSANNFFSHIGFRDAEYEDKLIKNAKGLWDCVIAQTVPQVDEDIAALDDILEIIDVSSLKTDENKVGLIAYNFCEKRQLLLEQKTNYNKAIKDIDEQIAKLDTQIAQKCDDSKVSVAEKDNVKYIISFEHKVSNRFDKAGFLKAFPDQKDNIKLHTKQSESNKMSIKRQEIA